MAAPGTPAAPAAPAEHRDWQGTMVPPEVHDALSKKWRGQPGIAARQAAPPPRRRTRTAAGGRRFRCSRRLSSFFWLVWLMWDVHLDEICRLARFNQAKAHVPFDPPCNYRRNYSDL